MKGLAGLARRASQARKAMVVRGGGGGPLAQGEVPKQPLAEQDELIWDDGTANPEPCLDEYKFISTEDAIKWLLGGLSVFAGIIGTVSWMDPAKKDPYGRKQLIPGAVPPEVANARY